jgi:hypothetical protein
VGGGARYFENEIGRMTVSCPTPRENLATIE